MEITYDSLIKLNKIEENLNMVLHLENKKREYFKENFKYDEFDE